MLACKDSGGCLLLSSFNQAFLEDEQKSVQIHRQKAS